MASSPRELFARLARPSLAWGYAAIVIIAAGSTIGKWLYDKAFALSGTGTVSYPFITFSIAIFGLICLARPLWLVVKRHPQPLRQLWQDIQDNRWWLVTSVLVAVAIPQTLEFSSTIKKAIPLVVPFYADQQIISLEFMIFGRDVWQITHSIFGPRATSVIDLIYGGWHLVHMSLMCWMVLSRDMTFQVRAMLAFQLIWLILGGVLATLLSSVGPCFLEVFTGDTRFAPLMAKLHAIGGPDGLHSLIAMGYLLDNEGKDAFGAGISAMPSLHVAIAYLFVLIAFDRTRLRTVRLIVIGYAMVILIGSVHLGWHYLLDGLVAIPCVHAIWWISGQFVLRVGHS